MTIEIYFAGEVVQSKVYEWGDTLFDHSISLLIGLDYKLASQSLLRSLTQTNQYH